MKQLHAEMLASTFPIFIFIDTNLNSTIESHEFCPNTFNVFRCDRSVNTSTKSSHGGVLIAVDKHIKSEMVIHGDSFGCEQLWVKIALINRDIYLGGLYISPRSTAAHYDSNMQLIKQLHTRVQSNDTIFLCGDFNMPNLQWIRNQSDHANKIFDNHSQLLSDNSLHPLNIESEIEENVVTTCLDIGLSQINCHPNDNGRFLDLIWSNDPECCSCHICINHLLKNEVHHKALSFNYYCEPVAAIPSTDEFFYDFRNADYTALNAEFVSIDWQNLLNIDDFEQSLSKFYAAIGGAIQRWVPLKKSKQPSSHPKWFDKKAIKLKNKMNALNKKHKKWQSTHFRNEYELIRNEYKHHIRHCFYTFKIQTQHEINENPH